MKKNSKNCVTLMFILPSTNTYNSFTHLSAKTVKFRDGMVGLSTFPMLCGGIWKPALGT